jgi:hypothetical protein
VVKEAAMSYEKKEDLEVVVVPEPERELVPREPVPTEPDRAPEPVPASSRGG